MTHIVNRNQGTYWRLMWSSGWKTLNPWALDGQLMPYIGARTSSVGSGVRLRVFGPLALASVTL